MTFLPFRFPCQFGRLVRRGGGAVAFTLLFLVIGPSSATQEPVILKGPSWSSQLVFSPDGKWLACVSFSREAVYIWEVGTAKKIIPRKYPLRGNASVAFSPDSKTLATPGLDKKVRLYDTATWKVRAEIPSDYGNIRCVAYSPDGKILAAATVDGHVKFWDAATLKPLPAPEEQIPKIRRLTFSPDGRLLAGAGFIRVVLWEQPSGKMKHELEGHKSLVRCAVFSPDSKNLATVQVATIEQFADGGLRATMNVALWDTATGKLRYHVVGSSANNLHAAAFSLDGKILAVVGNSGTRADRKTGAEVIVGAVQFYDVAANKHVGELPLTGVAETVAFSPDGRTLAVALNDGTVRLCDVSGKKYQAKH